MGRLGKKPTIKPPLKSLLSLTGTVLQKDSKKEINLLIKYLHGAMFIGLNGVSVKSHGGADYLGFANAISNAYIIVKDEMNKKIVDKI